MYHKKFAKGECRSARVGLPAISAGDFLFFLFKVVAKRNY
jgi:hypothetical protein